MSESLDHMIVLGTDIASFYVFHPDDLAHRATSPLGWETNGFACRKEFEAGRLVGWSTGGDGGYGLRPTDKPLTEREREYLAGSWAFRLRVRRGRVLVDNGDHLPNADYPRDQPDNESQQWLPLANGDYRVIVHAIEWYSEPGATDEDGRSTENALPSYIIQFERVRDMTEIPVLSSSPPRLECERSLKPWADDGLDATAAYLADTSPLSADPIVLLEDANWLIVPGFTAWLTVSDEVYDATYGTIGSQMKPNRIDAVVLAPQKPQPGQVAVLAIPNGASRSNNDPWRLGFYSRRLVRITTMERQGKWLRARVEPIERPLSPAARERLDDLKTAFTEYARTNEPFRKRVPTADFEAEQATAMTSAESVTHCLIHHLPFPLERKLELLLMPNAERVLALAAFFQDSQRG